MSQGRVLDIKQKTARVTWRWIALVVLMVISTSGFANDLQIHNTAVIPYNGGNGEIEFDITWQNSWRLTTGPNNWDAAWVFCKIRRNNGEWTHLNLNSTGHTLPTSPIAVSASLGRADTGAAHNPITNPNVGVFLYRTDTGDGTFTASDVRLQWSYADNGASSSDNIDIKVFAIEMVYVPQGAFYAGDGRAFTAVLRQGSTDFDPWYVTSEDPITTTSGASDGFYYVSAGLSGESASGEVFTVDSGFPKGFGAFYIMKGEISQGQWLEFFNAVTSSQKSSLDITGTSPSGKNSDGLVSRNNLSWTSGDATLPDQGGGADYSTVAMNFISWADVAAYLDWAGLRVMTELEFEKAARGPNAAVTSEFAWGTTALVEPTGITNVGLPTERVNVGSSSNYGLSGPVRVGSNAQGVTTRQASGAGFYGAMELSGNLYEQAVTVGNGAGRTFRGRYHGNGALTSDGRADVSTWPSVNNNVGMGLRGGSWYDFSFAWAVSDRGAAAFANPNRNGYYGGRGVRSAP